MKIEKKPTQNKLVAVRMTYDDHEMLKRVAKKLKVSVSDVLRAYLHVIRREHERAR
jgi:hypothetical protein